MSLGPKAMGNAIVRNLEKKTGKNLAAWLEVLSGISWSEKKAIVAWLKSEHQLGHFQAVKIAEHYLEEDDPYAKEHDLVARLLSTPQLREDFARLRKQIDTLGDDVHLQPCRTYLPFYRKQQFAIVVPGKNAGLILGVPLSGAVDYPGLVPFRWGSARIAQGLTIPEGQTLSPEAFELVRQAYAQS